MDFKHIMSKVRDAATNDDPGGMSLGEALTVALVLNRPDWLEKRGYTIAQALDRIDEESIPLLRKAERAWREECADNASMQRIQATANTAAVVLGPAGNKDPIYLDSEFVTSSDAPGYRDVGLRFDVRLIGEGVPQDKHRIELRIRPEDAEMIVNTIVITHRYAWYGDRERGPLDRKPGEQRPTWIDGRI